MVQDALQPRTSQILQPGYTARVTSGTGLAGALSNPDWQEAFVQHWANQWAYGNRTLPAGMEGGRFGLPDPTDIDGQVSARTLAAFARYAAAYQPGLDPLVDQQLPWVPPQPNDYVESPEQMAARIAEGHIKQQYNLDEQQLGYLRERLQQETSLGYAQLNAETGLGYAQLGQQRAETLSRAAAEPGRFVEREYLSRNMPAPQATESPLYGPQSQQAPVYGQPSTGGGVPTSQLVQTMIAEGKPFAINDTRPESVAAFQAAGLVPETQANGQVQWRYAGRNAQPTQPTMPQGVPASQGAPTGSAPVSQMVPAWNINMNAGQNFGAPQPVSQPAPTSQWDWNMNAGQNFGTPATAPTPAPTWDTSMNAGQNFSAPVSAPASAPANPYAAPAPANPYAAPNPYMEQGGATTSPASIVGDSSRNKENQEVVINPTRAPLIVIPVSQLMQSPQFEQGTKQMPHYQYGTGFGTGSGSGTGYDSVPSYQDSAYQNLPGLEYLKGNLSSGQYGQLATGTSQGAFGTKLPEVGALNYRRLYDLMQDPISFQLVSSLFKSGSRDLPAEISRVQARAPIGQAVSTSLIRR